MVCQVAKQSATLRSILEDLDASDEAIPIPNVNATILEKVCRARQSAMLNQSSNDLNSIQLMLLALA